MEAFGRGVAGGEQVRGRRRARGGGRGRGRSEGAVGGGENSRGGGRGRGWSGDRGGRGHGGGGRGRSRGVSGGGGRGGRGGQGSRRGRRRRNLFEGMCGFLLTYNSNERDCTKEGLNLLYEYGVDAKFMPNILLDPMPNAPGGQALEKVSDVASSKVDTPKEGPPDIDKELGAELAELNMKEKDKFYACNSGINNVVFIYSRVDVSTLAHKILTDISEKKVQKSKTLLRMIPVELTCMDNMEALESISHVVFSRYFKEGSNSFEIIVNVNYNDKINKTEVIKMLAASIGKMNPLNVMNMTDPTFTVIVEVIHFVCCLSVVRDYAKLKKYNLLAAAGVDCSDQKDKGSKVEKKSDVSEAGGQSVVELETEALTAEDEEGNGTQAVAEGQGDGISQELEYDGGDS